MSNSTETWDAIIVGGAIAGCSAAIQLSKLGHKTLVLERANAGDPKLCGEFLSPEARGYLDELGALNDTLNLGARPIAKLKITEPKGASIECDLPSYALGISRSSLDSVLTEQVRSCGAHYIDNTAVTDISGSLNKGFLVETSSDSFRASMVLGAYGKKAKLDQAIGRTIKRSPFVAFKSHFSGSHLTDAIEIFSFPGGYIGFSPVEDGMVNGCLIAHRSSLDQVGGRADDLFNWAGVQNPALGERLAGLTSETKQIGCSDISFETKGCFQNDICMIGDTAGMIAPLCGDGMSMAMHSAMIAAESADMFLRGELTTTGFRHNYASKWKKAYSLRLALGRILQQISLNTTATSMAVTVCSRTPILRDMLIRGTRGTMNTTIETKKGLHASL